MEGAFSQFLPPTNPLEEVWREKEILKSQVIKHRSRPTEKEREADPIPAKGVINMVCIPQLFKLLVERYF